MQECRGGWAIKGGERGQGDVVDSTFIVSKRQDGMDEKDINKCLAGQTTRKMDGDRWG